MTGLTPAQLQQYREEGYTIIEDLFSAAECQSFIDHMMELHSGKKTLEGFAARPPDEWSRTHNQHLYDSKALDLLLDPRLRQPLEDCCADQVEGIQTMYFWVGSQQRRHQDQFYLPGCMSAWIALIDANQDNGALWIQPRSHRQYLVTKEDFRLENGQLDPEMGHKYNDAVDTVFDDNDLAEIPVQVRRGDVVFFHGALIHRGGAIEKPGTFRHSMANHYIPYHFADWPHHSWTRYSFDGGQRKTSNQE